jgi:hypothetical protein
MHVLTADGYPEGGLLMPDPDTLRSMEAAPNLITLLHDGMPVAAGGTMELWHRRHMSWALLPAHSGPHMLAATREAYRRARMAPGRVEMTVLRSFAAGHRWAEMLGFEVETPVLKGYGPDGADFTGYVLFNGG